MMRAPSSDLPVSFERTEFRARGVKILNLPTLTIPGGAPTAIVGPNGAGKTTLLRLAMGLLTPTSGRITWGGREDVPPLRRALLFQKPVMLMRSAARNIDYALASVGIPRSARKARIDELLALVGLSAIADRPARRLSGGEQQRLALARALAREPELLLLDEPTASLDPAAAKSVEDVLREVTGRGIKIVMTTHDLGTAKRIAGEVILLHRGEILEHSPADIFFSRPATDAACRFQAGDLLI
jgi:tungstate transport system ATP-binding protein